MRHLSTVARIITPLAMVVFLAYEINRSMAVDGYWAVALLIGAIGTAVGIEIVGILAGHALEGYWNLGDKNRATLSFVLLIVYTATAVYVLRKNEAMVLVPVIAAIVYLLASLTTNLETTIDDRKDNEAEIKAFNREQAKADRDLERELKRQKQADDTAVKLARVEARAVSRKQVRSAESSGKLPTDYRKLTDSQKLYLSELTREERQKELPHLSDRTFRNWNEKLDEITAHKNGKVKEA